MKINILKRCFHKANQKFERLRLWTREDPLIYIELSIRLSWKHGYDTARMQSTDEPTLQLAKKKRTKKQTAESVQINED